MGKVSVVSRSLQSVRLLGAGGRQQRFVVSGFGERSQQRFVVSEDGEE